MYVCTYVRTYVCFSTDLVHFPAIQSDLAAGSGQRADVPHLDHRRDEVGGEGRAARAVCAHQRVLRPAVEQFLVGVEEAALRHQVLVVRVVELCRGLDVERGEVAVAARLRARLLAERGEGRVDVGVVVDVAAEGGAPRLPDGVGAGERRHVAGRQALGGEHRDERREARPGAWQVGVRRALARGLRIAAAQLYRPTWPPKLQRL